MSPRAPLPIAEDELELSDEQAAAMLAGDGEAEAPEQEEELNDEVAAKALEGSLPEKPSFWSSLAGGALEGLASVADLPGAVGSYMAGTKPGLGGVGSRGGPLAGAPVSVEESEGFEGSALGAGLRGAAQGVYPEETRGRGGFLSEDLPGLVGQVGPGLAAAALNPVAGAAVFFAQEGVPTYYDVLQETGDVDTAITGLLGTGAVAQLEHLGLGGTVARIVKKLGAVEKATGAVSKLAILKSMGRSGASEQGTEVIQQGLSDVIVESLTGEDIANIENLVKVATDPSILVLGSGIGLLEGVVDRAKARQETFAAGAAPQGSAPIPEQAAAPAPQAAQEAPGAELPAEAPEAVPAPAAPQEAAEEAPLVYTHSEDVPEVAIPKGTKLGKAQPVAIKGLELRQLERLRNGVDEERVTALMSAMSEGATIPAVTAFRTPGGKLTLLDGHHRVVAAERLGFESVPVRIADGERQAELTTPQVSIPGAVEAEAVQPAASGVQQLYGGLPPLPGKLGVSTEKAVNWTKAQLRSRGHAPAEVERAIEKAAGKRSAEAREIRVRARDLQKAAKAAFGKEWLVTHGEALDAALKSPEALAAMPESVQRPLVQMRNHIDQMSRELIRSGALGEGSAEVVERNLGEYVNRVYRAFVDPKWKEKVPEEVRNRLFTLWQSWSAPLEPARKAELRSKVRERSEEGARARAELRGRKALAGKSDVEIRGEMDAILQEAFEEVDSPLQHVAASKVGRKNLSILRHRKSIPQELRDFLGEIKSPLANYAASVSKIARLVSQHEALSEIKTAGLGKWLHERPQGAHVAKLGGDDSPGLAPLAGLYTTPEIKKALLATSPQEANLALRVLLKSNAAIKWGKIVGSPIQVLRQVQGNSLQLLRNGHGLSMLSPKMLGKALRPTLEEAKRLDRLGITGQSIAADEFLQLKAAQQRTPEEELAAEKNPYSIFGSIKKGAETVYQAPDEIQRRLGFYAEEAYLLDLGKSPKEAEELAAIFVQEHYPTWSRIVPLLKHWRRQPFLGSYMAFVTEQWRNAGNLLATISKEIRSPIGKVRARGFARAGGAITASSLMPAAALTINMLNGVDREDDEAKREFVPPWDKESRLVWLGKEKKGRYIDFSDIDPASIFTDPIARLLEGENLSQVVADFTRQQRDTYVGPSPIGELLVNVAAIASTGNRLDGKPVDDLTQYVIDEAQPGLFQQARRGAEKGFGPEVAALFTGRQPDFDVEKSLGIEAWVFRNRLSDLTAALNREKKKTGERSKESLKELEASRKELFRAMSRKAKAARTLGVSAYRIEELLDVALSKEMATAVLGGGYIAYVPPKE